MLESDNPTAHVFFLGAAASLLLFCIIKLGLQYRHIMAARWLMLFLFCGISFCVKPLVAAEQPFLHFLLFLLTAMLAPAFWLFCYALSRDSKNPPLLGTPFWGLMLCGLNLLLHILAAGGNFSSIQFCFAGHDTQCTSALTTLDILAYATTVALFALAGWMLLVDAKDDLVVVRLRLRWVILTALTSYFVIAAVVIGATQAAEMSTTVLTVRTFMAWLMATAMSVWIFQLVPSALLPDLLAATQTSPQSRTETQADQQQIVTKLNQAMASGVYRTAGLSIANLAAQIDAPEYQLRRAINGQLAHRNFSTYIDEQRIEEAADLLASKEHADLSVIEIALTVGFGSLNPFNLAFKQQMKITPSQYRAQAHALNSVNQ